MLRGRPIFTFFHHFKSTLNMYHLIVFFCLVAIAHCEITCDTTDGQTCQTEDFCYEAFARDDSGSCKAIRNCIDQTFQFPGSNFRKQLINYEGSLGLFRVCGKNNCNNSPANEAACDPKVVDNGSSATGWIGGLIIGAIVGIIGTAGIIWFFKLRD